jgi:hypothetical protein
MDLQHINVKLPLLEPGSLDWDTIIRVFHSWIQDQVCEELLIDVADYRHVSSGPGIILIGLEANYSLDNKENRPGLRYNRKAITTGSNLDRIRQSINSAFLASRRLEEDLRLRGVLQFDRREFEIFINDRYLAPNTVKTYEAVSPILGTFLREATNARDHTLEWNPDCRSLFGVKVRSREAIDLERMPAT